MQSSISTVSTVAGIRTCAPPSAALRAQIEARLLEGVAIVRSKPFYQDFPMPKLAYFDRRVAAGLAFGKLNLIALNRPLFELHLAENLLNTVLHELAHLVVRYAVRQGMMKKPASHGKEWKHIMSRWFGLKPSRTHDMCTDQLAIRRQKRWAYRCQCKTWQIATARHNLIQKQNRKYTCKACSTLLVRDLSTQPLLATR